jgi:hypothetical protein
MVDGRGPYVIGYNGLRPLKRRTYLAKIISDKENTPTKNAIKLMKLTITLIYQRRNDIPATEMMYTKRKQRNLNAN